MPETPEVEKERFSPVASLLILFGMMVVLSSVAQLAFIVPLIKVLTGASDAAAFFLNPGNYPHGWITMMILQAISSLFSFTIPAIAYWKLAEKQNINLGVKSSVHWQVWPLLAFLVIGYMPFNSLIYEFNQKVPMAEWMTQSEEKLEVLTKFLTQFPTFPHFLIGLFVVGVLPAVGEELLFRGTLQNLFERWWGRPHLAIWLAAIIFSAYHLQFMGFVPRVVLGAMFGYLYVWTRNLWVPIVAHFINNGSIVLLVYLRDQKLTTLNVDDKEPVSWMIALFSGIFTLAALRLIYQRTVDTRNIPSEIR